MQELTLMLIRFAYLAILWIFVFGAISVIRSDMFGARPDGPPAASRREQRAQNKAASKRGPKRTRGQPSKAVVVDGSRVRETQLRDGQRVRVGNTDILVRFGGAR